MIDDGETDTKLIGCIDDDFNNKGINSINDVPADILKSFEDFFKNYKNYKNATVLVPGFEDHEYAKHELDETLNLFKKYSTMPKKEFIAKMQEEHPEKYVF